MSNKAEEIRGGVYILVVAILLFGATIIGLYVANKSSWFRKATVVQSEVAEQIVEPAPVVQAEQFATNEPAPVVQAVPTIVASNGVKKLAFRVRPVLSLSSNTTINNQ